MRIVFLVIALFTYVSIFAQKVSEIDSLFIELKKIEDIDTKETDSIEVKILTRIGFRKVFNDLPKAKDLLWKAESISSKRNLKKSYNEILNIKGIYYSFLGKQDSSEYFFKKSLNYSRKYGFRKIECKSINNLGLYYWNTSNLKEAQECFFESLKIGDDLGLDPSSSLSNIGLIYQELELYEKAIEFHKKAYAIRLENKNIEKQPVSLNNLGICYRNTKQYKKAIISYEKCISLSKEIGDFPTLYRSYENIGNLYFDLKQYDKTLKYYNLSADRTEKYPLTIKAKMVLFTNLSRTYVALEKYNTALRYGLKAKGILDKNKELEVFSEEIFQSLAASNFALGNIDDGFLYNTMYYESLKNVFSKENLENINELEAKYETEKKEKELLRIKSEKTTTELELNNQKQVTYGLIWGALVLVLIGFSVFQRNKRKHQEAIAKEKEQNLQSIILAEEKERRRIARELHDGIVQEIGSVILNSRNVFSKLSLPDQSESEQLLVQLENSSKELRTISHQMMPRALEEVGFSEALEQLLDSSFKSTTIKYSFDAMDIQQRFSKDIEITLYRVSQELFQNIIKHSKASEVQIQLLQNENFIIYMVEDNGKGFVNKKEKGIGLSNIKSRIDMIHGAIVIDSNTNGTLVTIKISKNAN